MIVDCTLVRRGLRIEDGTTSVSTTSLSPRDRNRITRHDDSIEIEVGGGTVRCTCLSMNGWSDWHVEVTQDARITSISTEWQLSYDLTDRVRVDDTDIARDTPLFHESTANELLLGSMRLRRLPASHPEGFEGRFQVGCDAGQSVWVVRSAVVPKMPVEADLATRIAFRRGERISPRLGCGTDVATVSAGSKFRVGLTEA